MTKHPIRNYMSHKVVVSYRSDRNPFPLFDD